MARKELIHSNGKSWSVWVYGNYAEIMLNNFDIEEVLCINYSDKQSEIGRKKKNWNLGSYDDTTRCSWNRNKKKIINFVDNLVAFGWNCCEICVWINIWDL